MITKDELSLMLASTGKKAIRIEELQTIGALDDINIGSVREIAGLLRQLGWTSHTTGRMRAWIAPGETPTSANMLGTRNKPITITRTVRALVDGLDEIGSRQLVRMVEDKTDLEEVAGIVNAYMPRIGFYIDKHVNDGGIHNNIWKRKQPRSVTP